MKEPAPSVNIVEPATGGGTRPPDGQAVEGRPIEARPIAARPILDIEDGLDRIMGDRVLYFKLLRRFQHDYTIALPKLRDMLGADRYDAARVMAHTLKGAAGMIGARAVHAQAAELESAVRAQALAMEPQLEHLEQALNQTLATIRSVLHNHPEDLPAPLTPAPDPSDPATLLLIGRLSYFLQEGDGAAIDILESSATVLAAMLGVEVYQQVASAAHEFDFESALAALRQRR